MDQKQYKKEYITLHKIKVVARFYVTQYVEILAIFN